MYIPYDVNYDDLVDAITGAIGKRSVSFRIYLLDETENFIEDISNLIEDGNVDVDIDRDVTRGASLNMVNLDGDYTLEPSNPFGKIWYTSRFALYYGIYVGGSYGATVWIPVGVYLLDTPGYSSDGKMSLSLIGKNSLINYVLGESVYLESGLNVEEALRRLICSINHQEDSDGSTKNTNFTWNGSWSISGYDANLYGGYHTYSNTTNNYVEWTFTGKQVTWITKKQNNLGIANVYIDGALDTTVDLYASSAQYHQHIYAKEFPYGGQHTIKIEVSGTKNGSSSDYHIIIDALQASRVFKDSEIAFENSGRTLDKIINYTADQNRWACARELANSYSLVLFEDGQGLIRSQVYPVFSSQEVDWTYEKGEYATITKVSKSNKGPRYNHVIVSYGDSESVTAYREAKAEDDDGASEFKTTGPLGDRVLIHRDSNVKTTAKADNIAEKLLEEYLAVAEEISISGITNPLHDPYDKIRIVEGDYTKIASDYSLRQFTIPLGYGKEQQFTVKKMRSL